MVKIKKGAHRSAMVGEAWTLKIDTPPARHNIREFYVWMHGDWIPELVPYLPEWMELRPDQKLAMPTYEQRSEAQQIEASRTVFHALCSRFPALQRNKVHKNNVGFRPDGSIVLLDLADIYPLVKAEVDRLDARLPL